MKNSIIWILFSFIVITTFSCQKAETPAEPQWTSIFNGKDLSGWKVKLKGFELGVNDKNTFRVQDGVLKVSYDQYETFNENFGHIFYDKYLSNYRVRFEYRFVGEQTPGGPGWAYRNSGIMLHGQKPETMGINQNFPVSIEAQLLGGNGTDDRTTGNLCTPGTNVVLGGELILNHCTNSSSKTYHGDQWVKMECEVHGAGIIKHYVNDELVLQYEQSQYDPRDEDAQKLITSDDLLISGGYFSLQAESHGVEFRNIEIMILDE